jgi:Protein of unknown function (DUF3667)
MEKKTITCKNCGHVFTGNYCNQCGEKVYTEKDRSVLNYFEEGFHFLTHFDGTFFTTVKTIFGRPGQLSVNYTFGIRKRYFKLLSLFLLLVVIYLLFPAFEGLNMKLIYHMQNNLYGRYAQHQVVLIRQRTGLSMDQLSDEFHRISEKTSKILLLLLIPLTALATWAVTYKKRRRSFDQMVFATEINCFYLIFGFLLLPLLLAVFEWTVRTFGGHYLDISDDYVGLLISLALVIFAFVGGKRFYNFRPWQALLFALYFLVLHTFIVHYLYKFILFFVVIHQTH